MMYIRSYRRWHRLILTGALSVMLLNLSSVAMSQENTFTNPLLAYRGADPWIVYHEGSYYLIATSGASELFMRKSPTLDGLRDADVHKVWQETGLSDRCCNMWAPELHFLDGPNGPRWYLYYTAGAPGTDFARTQYTHVLESAGTDPLGPYEYKARVFDPANDTPQLDGTILQLDGQLYFVVCVWDLNAQNLYIAPMSDPWTISGERRLISTPIYEWEKSLAPINEGPVALQRDGTTFVIFSASACWGPDYKLGMLTLTGDDPLEFESWTKHPEPVFQRSDEHGVFGPGHNGFFKSPDGTEDWIIYHANDSVTGGCDDRRTPRAQPFTWNDDGTPNFGVPVATGLALPVPSGEEAP